MPVSPEREFVDRTVEYLVEINVLAAYEPLTNELMVVRGKVDDSNLDGLKLVLAHELTHRGQHVHHPALFERASIEYLFFSLVCLYNLRQMFYEMPRKRQG